MIVIQILMCLFAFAGGLAVARKEPLLAFTFFVCAGLCMAMHGSKVLS